MPTPNGNTAFCFLTKCSMKESNISKSIEESVRWRVFDQSLTEARAKFADLPADDLQAIISEATQSIKNEMRKRLSSDASEF